MPLINGIVYNFKGLVMGLTNLKLLFWGMLRVVVVVVLTILCAGLVLMWHQEILNMLWTKPESGWLVFVWQIASWSLSFFLAAASSVLSYIVAQLLFSVFVMDYMSRITEELILGQRNASGDSTQSFFSLFFYLIKQEIPRAIIPLFIMLFITILGFLTPFGPIVALASSILATVFLAWDNTDLVPARRMVPFSKRLGFLRNNIMFHVGFGLCFMIPWINILFLSFAPVGATIYFIERELR